MVNQEFRTQIFKTREQWEKGGLSYRLEKLTDGCITLYSMPTFDRWIQEIDNIKNPVCFSDVGCGQIYFIDKEKSIDKENYQLYYYDIGTKRLEKISCIGGRGSEPGMFTNPKKIIIEKSSLLVLDAEKIKAFSKENFQIKFIIDTIIPIDIAFDTQGYLYALEANQIIKYDINGHFLECYKFGDKYLKKPVGLAIDNENNLFVIDGNHFLKFTAYGQYLGSIGIFSKISDRCDKSKEIKPLKKITIDKKGSIFVVDETEFIFQFDHSGSFLGNITIPDFQGKINDISINSNNDLLACTDKGIALFSSRQKFTREKGVYYTKTLDCKIPNSSEEESQWHRFDFEAKLPPRSVIEVYYYSSKKIEDKDEIDKILSNRNTSIQEKVQEIENSIQKWNGPEVFGPEISIKSGKKEGDTLHNTSTSESESTKLSMLFRTKTERYLWVKVVLLTYDESVRPSIIQMKVYYPRISYLRYLPKIYQENPANRDLNPEYRDFLERFLSIFEKVFYDLENEISHIFRYFDPDTSRKDFLIWLASWLNLGLEEEWTEETKRKFIREAYKLYRLKGTPDGLRKLIEIYTGKRAIILEHSKIIKPFILGGEYLFRWDSVPGKDSERLIRFLEDDLETSLKNASIIKLEEGKTIRILTEEKSFEIKLNENKKKALLKISDGRTYYLQVEKENGMLSIYMEKVGIFRLGINSILMQTPVRGFLLGSDNILGRVVLRDKVQSIEDPFLELAHRFTVILDLSANELTRFEKGLKRIIDEGKPAHTMCNIRVAKDMKIGEGVFIGVNAKIPEYIPIHLGDTSAIGSSIIVSGRELNGEDAQQSRSYKNIKLI